MPKLPDNPNIGQALLPAPSILYVWSGYQWILATGRYGSFYDEITQAAVINTATPVILRNTDFYKGVSIEADLSGNLTQIHLDDTGKYNIAFSLQLDRVSGSGNVPVVIWLRKNEIDVPWSASQVIMSGNANVAKVIAAWNFFVETTSHDDYFQLMWRTTDANIQIVGFPANLAQPNPAAYPATPPIILTVNQVGY